MLRILGQRTRLCDGVTRREMLQAGAISGLGLSVSLPGALELAWTVSADD